MIIILKRTDGMLYQTDIPAATGFLGYTIQYGGFQDMGA